MIFVHAVFKDEPHAAKAVQELVNAKFSSTDISALMCHRGGAVEELEVGHKTAMKSGAAVGAVLGGVGGALAVTGGLVLAGPLFLALEGLVAGGALGTVAGTLGGLGFWKEEIEFPKNAFEDGAVLIGASVNEGRAEEASAALKRAGATEILQSTQEEARLLAESRTAVTPHS